MWDTIFLHSRELNLKLKILKPSGPISRSQADNKGNINKNCLWQPCLLMDQAEMSNLYRGPSIDTSYQVSYHLAKRFQRKSCSRNRPIRKKNCLRRPYLLTDQNGMSNSHRGPSIDASYHVSVHLAKLF